jgi:hypothetical protein
MNRIEKLKKIIIPASIGLAILLILAIVMIQSTKKNVTPSEKTQASFDNVIPGVSSKKDLVDKLGNPIKTSTSSAYPDEFKSTSPTRNTQAYYDKNTVSIIREVVTSKDNIKVSDLTQKYGSAPYKLYGTDSTNGYFLFVLPDIGFAYLGNPQVNILLEIWYYPKTTISTFIEKYAPGYSYSPLRQQ